MSLRENLLALFALISLVGTPENARCQTYQPLDIGNFWSYQGPSGEQETHIVQGTRVIRGTPVYVVKYSGGHDDGLENYWTTDASGDLFLWGFYAPNAEFGLVYDPPLLFLDSPLALGDSWQTTFSAYSLPDTSYFGQFTFRQKVYEEGVVTVPAGDFYAYGVGEAPGAPSPSIPFLADHDLAGNAISTTRGGAPTSWFSQDVGEVQLNAFVFLKLTAYLAPTPTTPSSWGALKHRFARP